MREIDRMYIKLPFFGTRKVRKRFGINRKRAQRLMRLMGLEAICPKRSTSRPAPGCHSARQNRPLIGAQNRPPCGGYWTEESSCS